MPESPYAALTLNTSPTSSKPVLEPPPIYDMRLVVESTSPKRKNSLSDETDSPSSKTKSRTGSSRHNKEDGSLDDIVMDVPPRSRHNSGGATTPPPPSNRLSVHSLHVLDAETAGIQRANPNNKDDTKGSTRWGVEKVGRVNLARM